jgi:hypothetical protein
MLKTLFQRRRQTYKHIPEVPTAAEIGRGVRVFAEWMFLCSRVLDQDDKTQTRGTRRKLLKTLIQCH